MITGSIKLYEEPEKVTKYRNDNWGWMYEDWSENTSTEYWKNLDTRLCACLNEGTLQGLKLGARVKRASGNPGEGTITHIHRTHTMAWNETNRQLEPFKVTWDKSIGSASGGTFDYCADDLVVLEPKKDVPALFILPQLGVDNETIPGLC